MTIYIDADFKCHPEPGEFRNAVDTDFFDGKCPAYMEGYRFVPAGAVWTREDGAVFHGEMVAPWKDWTELDALQREYEKKLIADYAAALETLGVTL